MLKFVVLSLLAINCQCAEVIEVTGNNVVRQSATHLPLKTVNVPHSSAVLSSLPLSLGYGYNNLGYGINGLNLGLAGVRSSVLAPQVLSLPAYQRSNLLAIRQGSLGLVHQPSLAIAQPQVAHLAVSQPALAVQRHVVAAPQVNLAVRPQAYVSEAVRPVNAAVQQIARTVEYRTVPNSEQPIVPQEVVVEPSDQPINIHFKSRSSTVRLSQEHIPGEPGTIEQTQSQDEPSKVVHEVVKPVIQEVREVIQPYRQVTQEVQPVVENVHTVVTEGQGRAQYVAEPVAQRVAVQQVRPLSVAVAQPALAVAERPAIAQVGVAVAPKVQTLAIAQPHIQTLGIAQPQLQTLGIAQPQLQTLGIRELVQPHVQTLAVREVAQPIHASLLRTPTIQTIAQPVVGFNRVVSVEQPSVEVRGEVKPEVRVSEQKGSDYVRYAETD